MINFWPYYVQEKWRHQLKGCRRVALFGAGEHTRWLLETLERQPTPKVTSLVDDAADRIREVRGFPVVRPDQLDPSSVDAIVISSDSHESKLFTRAKSCFPTARIERLYEGLPAGPYEKFGELPEHTYDLTRPGDRINLETVVSYSQSAEVKRKLIEIFNRLDPDPFISQLSDGYARGLNRFGEHWRYVDLWSLLYGYAFLAKPKTYLEIGTRRGHSLAVVCSGTRDGGGEPVEVVSCDLWVENYAGTANPGPEFVKGQLQRLGFRQPVQFLCGSSHEILPGFLRLHASLFDLITVDGDHSHDGAKDDLLTVIDSVAFGGLLAFDDLAHPQHPKLLEVWQSVLAPRPDFETYANTHDGTGTAGAIRFR